MPTAETLELIRKASDQSDRFLFVAILVVLAVSVSWLVQWLMKQNKALVESLNQAHTTYQGKLETIVEKSHAAIQENTEATTRQNELLRRIEDREVIRMRVTPSA